MPRHLVVLAVLAACTSPPDDVTGPYTGTIARFIVDGFTLPRNSVEAGTLGDDSRSRRHD